MAATIEEVVRRVPAWRGRPVVIGTAEPLAGGMTNTSYRVEVEGRWYVVRTPGASTELLGIDRRNEAHNTEVAAAAGVGPCVVADLPELDALVVEWIPGRRLTNADLQAPGMPTRLAATLRALHAGPRFLRDFDMFRLIDGYLAVADARALSLPPRAGARLATVRRIEAALAARPWPRVPCHNDLVADNVIDDGRRLRLIDYEYSGNGDSAFELGNACRELDYDGPRIAELVEAYFGAAPAARLARVQLYMLVADVGWALWATVQTAISRLPLDFGAYGATRWARAEAWMDGSDLPAWLELAEALPG